MRGRISDLARKAAGAAAGHGLFAVARLFLAIDLCLSGLPGRAWAE